MVRTAVQKIADVLIFLCGFLIFCDILLLPLTPALAYFRFQNPASMRFDHLLAVFAYDFDDGVGNLLEIILKESWKSPETAVLALFLLLAGICGAVILVQGIRLLASVAEETELRLVEVCGGLKDNAIPTGAQALISANAEVTAEVCRRMTQSLREEYRVTDPDVEVTVEPAETAMLPMDAVSPRRAVCLLVCHPNGVQVMSADIPGLVQTSLNMGILTTGETEVHLSSSVRSSVESQKQMLLQRIACLTAELGGETSTRGEYPGWAYLPDSPLRDLMVEVFTDQYGYEPKVEAIHAGLECGLFSAKLPGLDCVSFGPDLKEIHTFREKMSISSVQRVWKMLVELLRRMKETCALPVVVKPAQARALDGDARALFEAEARRTDLFGLCFPTARPCGLEWTRSPVVKERQG